MYPARELSRLAAHKHALQRRITRRRLACVAAAAEIARPIAWLDRALVVWRKLSPWMHLAAVPLGFLRKNPPGTPPAAWLRWLPAVMGAMRAFRAVRGR